MTDIPIIFSAARVRALLDGRQSMTRRLAWGKKCRHCGGTGSVLDRARHPTHPVSCRQCRGVCLAPSPWQKVKPGDRLWVRENFIKTAAGPAYAAGGHIHFGEI